MRFAVSVIIACCFLFGKSAEGQVKEHGAGLVPYFDISNPELITFASAVTYVFSISDLSGYYVNTADDLNFIFISQPNALMNGNIDRKNLTIFDDATGEEIAQMQSDTNECFVQPLFVGDRQIVIAINSAENGPIEIDKKCLLLGLALLADYNPTEIENLNGLDVPELTMRILNRSYWGSVDK